MRLDLSRRTDGELLREFRVLLVNDRRSTAELLAYIGEIQARGLFRARGCSSMFKYCVHMLHMSEDMAWKRTQVARLARHFPVILDMIADGRLHLTAVVKLLPHRLAPDFDRLLEAATHKTKPELELLLAERFPQPDVPTIVQPLGTSTQRQKLVPEPVVPTHESLQAASSRSALGNPETVIVNTSTEGPVILGQSDAPSADPVPMTVSAPGQRARLQPLAPQRFALQVTIGQATHDKLRRAQELLGHRIASGDLEQVLDLALDALIRRLEHAKFAATDKPRAARQRPTAGKRHVPAHVKRAVFERDGGRCTFVGDSGRRCDERRGLELDHVDPFARGGEARPDRMRLLCRAHNQLAAECTYGAGFMTARRRRPCDPAGDRTGGASRCYPASP